MREAKVYYLNSTVNAANYLYRGINEMYYINCLENIENTEAINHTNIDSIFMIFILDIKYSLPIVWEFLTKLPISNGEKIILVNQKSNLSEMVSYLIMRLLRERGYTMIDVIQFDKE